MRVLWLWAVCLAIAATPAFGQACAGVPAHKKAISVQGDFGFAEGAKTYGAGINYNGSLSVAAGYIFEKFSDIDQRVNGVTVGLGYEVPSLPFSVCPRLAASYATFSVPIGLLTFSAQETDVTAGLGIGKTFQVSPSLGFSLYGVPSIVRSHVAAKTKNTIDVVVQEATENSTDFSAAGGFVFGTRYFYAGASLSKSTADGSDVFYFITVGINIVAPK